MTTVNINNNDILGKVNSINLLSHLNDVEVFNNNRDDLQELKNNLNIKDIADELTKLKNALNGVEEFTNDNDPKIKLLKDLFSNSSVAAASNRGFALKEPVAAPAPSASVKAQDALYETLFQEPAPVTAQAPVTSDKTGDDEGTNRQEGENSQFQQMHSSILYNEKETNSNPQIYSVEGKVGLTPEQQKEFDRINKNLNKQNKDEINLNNLSTKTPIKSFNYETSKSGKTIQWGNNPIWIGKIYTDERGEYKEGGYNVFMKDDGFSVVDKIPLNPAVLFSGENATIAKDGSNNYVLLNEKDEGQGYGFVFEYKGTVGTLSSYFGIDEGKTGGKKKSKSKRTKKNGSLKKRK